MLTLFTIGHSNHSFEHFLGLLQKHGVELVVDVRSRPYSRYVPHFSREALEKSLKDQGIRYLFLGEKLGGRPKEKEYYRADGTVDYRRLRESPKFQEGIEEVLALASRYRLALLCGEEDPTSCHRKLLVGRVLEDRGASVLHIRGNGEVEEAFRKEESGEQLDLL